MPGKLRGVLQLAGDQVSNLEQVETKLFSAVDQIQRNNTEQRKRQLRDIFMKFDVDIDMAVSNEDGTRKTEQLKRYISAVYDKKMDKLKLDLDGDWEEYMEVLMADNFWHEEAPIAHDSLFT